MMSRNWNACISLGYAFVLAALCVCGFTRTAHAGTIPNATIVKTAHHDMSKPLTAYRYDLLPIMQRAIGDNHPSEKQIQALRENLIKNGLIKSPNSTSASVPRGIAPLYGPRVAARDSVLQAAASATQTGGFTTPILSFDGLGESSVSSTLLYGLPDTSVAAGMNYVIESTSSWFAIYNKTNGSLVLGPVRTAALWSGFGGQCGQGFLQHATVVYDQLAHRWIFQYAKPYSSTYCVAISVTNNPAGYYYRYEWDNLPPSGTENGDAFLGVWPDAYYTAINRVSGFPSSITNELFIALDRSAMLQGKAANIIYFNVPKSSGAYADLPVTLEGLTPPPSGEPGLFANYVSPNLFGSGQPYALALWSMHVDWTNPGNATLQGPTDITVPAFNDMLCSNQQACIPQPYPGATLDAVSDRLMPGLGYRNFGGHEELVANQTVTASTSGNPPSGIRWYELKTSSAGAGDWSLVQSGTYDPNDGNSRWVGSMAMDHSGDMALGYSVSGTSMAPAVAYTGRLKGDTAGKMTEPETTLVAGYGVKQYINSWSDHSSMAVDPANGCTFWYGNEYYQETSSNYWSTHLAAFKFNSCTANTVGTVKGTVTSAASGQTISDAAVAITADGIVTDTDSDGNYRIKLPAGTYSATASHFGYQPENISVTVSSGGAVSDNFSLQKAPTATLSGHVTDGSGHGWGLYAEVKITTPTVGVVSDTWTNPATGAYSVALPKGFDYTVTVKPYVGGYIPPAPTTVTLNGNQVQDFSLTIEDTCNAPGYEFTKGYGEDFNESFFPPPGWTVTNAGPGSHFIWTTNAYWGFPNWTGGTGTAAMLDVPTARNRFGSAGSYDTSLVSPSIPVASLSGNPELNFKANVDLSLYTQDTLDLDISVDGGAWTNIIHWTRSYSPSYTNAIPPINGISSLPGYDAHIMLASYIPTGATSIRLRWRYYDPYSSFDFGYAQIDDVAIGVCHLVNGGLIVGHVSDGNTGAPLGQVSITDGNGHATTTATKLSSANRPAGTYTMFVPPAAYSLTARDPNYSQSTKTVTVSDNSVTTQDFALGAGLFLANPDPLTLQATAGVTQTTQLTVKNNGTAAAHFILHPINAPVASTQATGPFAAAPSYPKGTDLMTYSAVQSTLQPDSGTFSGNVQAAASATAGTVLAAFHIPKPLFSLTVDRQTNTLWLYSPEGNRFYGGDGKSHEYRFDGTPTGRTILSQPWDGLVPGPLMTGMAYDDVTGKIWQLSIDGSSVNSFSYIHEEDPRTGLRTGRKIKVPSPQREMGLAYDPATNTWYAGDFNSEAIYHFDASGKLLDSQYVGLPIVGLAYNPGTGHLFVLTSGGAHAVYILDAKNGYAPVGFFDIPGYNPNYSGPGLGYTCDGNLWISDIVDSEALEVASGEKGWCDVRHIPWLSLAPGNATVAKGASTSVRVTLDGTNHQPYTTSQAQLRLVGNTPYPVKTIPVTVNWMPERVALQTSVEIDPRSIVNGNYVTFYVSVVNSSSSGDGPANQVVATLDLPDNFSYIPEKGNNCTNNAGQIVCMIGNLAPAASKHLKIVAKADKTGPYQFTVQAAGKETQDPLYEGKNVKTIDGTVQSVGGSSGGGAFGGLSLTMLLLLAGTAMFARKRGGNRYLPDNFMKRGKYVFNRIKTTCAAATVMVVALFATTAISTAQAQPSLHGNSLSRHKSGLTARDLANIRHSINSNPRQVRLAPQTNVSLLKQGKLLGIHALSSRIKLTVSLKLQHVHQLKTFLRELQNPASSDYHRFLTPSEFTTKYGPTEAQVAQVEHFLTSEGIKVLDVSRNRMLIHTEGTTGAYENALNIRVQDFELHGRKFFSSEDRPVLPTAVASVVRNIVGLNNAVRMRPLHRIKPMVFTARQTGATGAPAPSSSYYEPAQIAKAYDWPSITAPEEGSGVRVAIVTAASSGLAAQAYYDTFWKALGLPAHTVNVIPVDGDNGQAYGMIETLLDMEWSGAMAPGETEDVYVAATGSFADLMDDYNQVVTDDKDQVMTTSWGAPESQLGSVAKTADQIFMQAAAQGISMFAAAGDNGSSDGTTNNDVADYPASDPYVTSANGTNLKATADGTYLSEKAWSHTGGAVSQIFAEPTWETGPGVPANGWLNDSDVAMNAGLVRPYLVYFPANNYTSSSWIGIGGTSAVAPQLAALFAIGVWQNGGNSLGQSNELIYGDVNAGNYATDFHDVTTGSNGAFSAGPNWDHPTGWGSPRGKSLLSHLGAQGPEGTLEGVITNSATGATINGATVVVTPGNFRRATDGNGHYSLLLAPGSYTVTVKDFGYQVFSGTVSVTDGSTTTEDAALQPAQKATITGHVTDGSGHGYGLYANVKVTSPKFGKVADVWTNPKDGSYSVKLPEGFDYAFTATAAFDGYNTDSLNIAKLSGAATHNFPLTILNTCTAPGYQYKKGYGEDFNNGFLPGGWSETSSGAAVAWAQAGGFGGILQQSLPNWTGGTGQGAVASAINVGIINGATSFDAQLISPVIPVASLPANPKLSFLLNYQNGSVYDALDVDVNVDGQGWTTVAHVAKSEGGFKALPGVKYSVDLSGYIPSGATSIQLRWRYYDTNYQQGVSTVWYAEIDDVSIGACQKIPGGIVYGQVSDANSGKGVIGATVSNGSGGRVSTITNPLDPNLPRGAYFLFAPTGQNSVIASDYAYTSSNANVDVAAGTVTNQNFPLKAGRLTASPGSLTIHATVDGQTHKTLTLNNSGTADSKYELLTINAPAPTASAPAYLKGLAAMPGTAGLAEAKTGPVSEIALGLGEESAVPAVTGGTAPGAIVAAIKTGIPSWGVGVDRNADALWIGTSLNAQYFPGADDKDHQYLPDGTNTGNSITVAFPGAYSMSDMAYDSNTGNLWQISQSRYSKYSCIYELDPRLMTWTGRKICPSVPVSMKSLAYDPVNNIWIAGVGHYVFAFDSQGNVLGSAQLSSVFDIQALAFNPSNQHLFVLNAGYDQIYVYNMANGFIDSPMAIHVPAGNFGYGLDYDCAGHLWLSDPVDEEAFEVNSGETGWCSYEHIPWLSVASASGTLATGASAKIDLNIDGTGQKPFTTSQVQLRVKGSTPYAEQSVPVTVDWEPQPVDLVTTAQAAPKSVAVGKYLTFNVAVKNHTVQGDGNASQVELSFNLPGNLKYVRQSTDNCAETGGTVVCKLGNIPQGSAQNIMILTQATKSGKDNVTFTAVGKEPQDNNYQQSDTSSVQAQVGGSGSSGGGAVGCLSLVILLGLALGIGRRHR